MIKRGKKGLSPIIATVLLIVITLIIAMIIFLWAKNFIGEKTKKFNEPVENACERVSFDAEAFESGDIDIINRGNVPLYGINVKTKGSGSIIDAGTFTSSIDVGETGKVSSVSVSKGDSIIVVPIVLGETGEYRTPYTCSDTYGKEIVVI